jgi:hypothetical protein
VRAFVKHVGFIRGFPKAYTRLFRLLGILNHAGVIPGIIQVPVCQACWNRKAREDRQRSKLDEDTASMAIVAAETDYGEVVGEGDGSGDTL